jgi:hypothetical protein
MTNDCLIPSVYIKDIHCARKRGVYLKVKPTKELGFLLHHEHKGFVEHFHSSSINLHIFSIHLTPYTSSPSRLSLPLNTSTSIKMCKMVVTEYSGCGCVHARTRLCNRCTVHESMPCLRFDCPLYCEEIAEKSGRCPACTSC